MKLRWSGHLNPVLTRELRARARGRRATVALVAYLFLLCGGLLLLYAGQRQSQGNGFDANAVASGSSIGQTMFGTLLFGILALVCFIVPAVTAPSIAGERERQTLVPLQITLMTPRQVLFGKLEASMAFTALLLVASLPLITVSYVVGGVRISQVLAGFAMVLAAATMIGCLSIWASVAFRRVQGATVVSLVIVLALVFGTPLAYAAQGVAQNATGRQDRHTMVVLTPNPFLALADVVRDPVTAGAGVFDNNAGLGSSPLGTMAGVLATRDQSNDFGGGRGRLVQVGGVIAGDRGPVPFRPAVRFPAPVAATTTVLAGTGTEATTPTDLPPSAAAPTSSTIPDFGSITSTGSQGFGGGQQFGAPFPEPGRPLLDRGPLWVWSICIWLALSALALWDATRLLRLPSRRGVRP